MASNHLNIAHMTGEAAVEEVVVAVEKAVSHNKHHIKGNLMGHQIIIIQAKACTYQSANPARHQTTSRSSITGIIATRAVMTLKTAIPAMNAGNQNEATIITLHVPTQWVAAIKENTKLCLGTRHKTEKLGRRVKIIFII